MISLCVPYCRKLVGALPQNALYLTVWKKCRPLAAVITSNALLIV
nr:MAG TPA: hypothetical protein [Caudoviricetes sp.]